MDDAAAATSSGDDPAAAAPQEPGAAVGPDELEPQLKYERLGADVKTILQDAAATCLALSEKVLALGTSAGAIHVLDYSGNEVKRFALHDRAVQHLSFDEKAEYVASCCGDSYISISSLYTDETTKFAFKRPITVVALEPRYASRKTREFVSGDVRGRLKLSSQGWLGRSDHVLHQGEGSIRAVTWHHSTLVWANEVGVKVYDTNTHQFAGSISRPRGGRFADCLDCSLFWHEDSDRLFVAWPDCIKVVAISSHVDPVSAATSKRLQVAASIPTDFYCMGAVPHGADLAVLVYVTDADPDQDQVGLEQQPDDAAAAAADAAAAQAGLTMAALPQPQRPQQQPPQHGEPQQQQQQQQQPAAAGGSSCPISIPQPVKRPQRAANAIVQSPSGPSFLQAAAAAAAAGTAAAATAAGADAGPEAETEAEADAAAEATGADEAAAGDAGGRASAGSSLSAATPALPSAAGSGTSSPAKTPRQATASSSSSSSPSKPPPAPPLDAAAPSSGAGASTAPSPRSVMRAAAGPSSAGRPPLPSYSRNSSATSRGSASDAAQQKPYVPPGRPLRPELRILTLQPGPSGAGARADGQPRASGAGAGPRAAAAAPAQQAGVCCSCVEKASDALSVKGYASCLPADYRLCASYGNELALLSSSRGPRRGGRRGAARGPGGGPGGGGGSGSGGSGSSGSQHKPPGDAAGAVEGAPAAEGAAEQGAGQEQQQQQQQQAEELLVEDFGEFMYFIVSPQDIVVGRHRDSEDRISWFLAARRFEAALSLAEADRTTRQEVWDTVVQAYLEALTGSGKWGAAAALLPRLVKDQAALWERWVYTFAQARQLPLLAPVLPVKQPQLHAQAYDMVLQALLLEPEHHGQLLELVSAWPPAIFRPTALIDSIAQRMQRPQGDSRELWQALALLYKGQGRPDLSLAIYLQLQLPSVFDFIQEHGLLLYLDQKAYLLTAIDERRALELLTAHLDTLPPAAVVPGLLDALALCEADGDDAGRETWRRRLFNYLDRVFQVDSSAGGEYAELAVHLYADYCPSRLMDFLQGSQSYPLEAALEVAQQRGLLDEQVYVLSRMGNSRAALGLIIKGQQDIPRAIEFVRLQADEELWETLIDWALGSADTTGQLLEHIGGNINPLRVIQRIPEGLAIDNLRDRLRRIIADFRTQTSLREGCNAILRSDCLHLVQRLQREVRRALPTVWVQRAPGAGAAAAAAATAAAAEAEAGEAAAATAGAGAAAGAPASTRKQPKRGGAGATAAPPSAVAAAGGFVPALPASLVAAGVAGKRPQWLRYQPGSGEAMQPASSQDVPQAALQLLGAAACAGGGHSATALAWPSTAEADAGVPLSPQPRRVWIGRSREELQQLPDDSGEGDRGAAASKAGSAASSRRGSRHHRQHSSGAVTLPSLVAA